MPGSSKSRTTTERRVAWIEEEIMEDPDDLPRKMDWQPKNLDALSIDQLEEYITVLEGEIARVRSNMAAKRSDLGAAEAIFKK